MFNSQFFYTQILLIIYRCAEPPQNTNNGTIALQHDVKNIEKTSKNPINHNCNTARLECLYALEYFFTNENKLVELINQSIQYMQDPLSTYQYKHNLYRQVLDDHKEQTTIAEDIEKFMKDCLNIDLCLILLNNIIVVRSARIDLLQQLTESFLNYNSQQ